MVFVVHTVYKLSHDLVDTYVYEGERSAEPGGWDAEGVLELGHHHVDGSSGGVATDQRLRQVGHHKTKVDQAQQDLHTHAFKYTHNDLWPLDMLLHRKTGPTCIGYATMVVQRYNNILRNVWLGWACILRIG